MLFVLCFTGIFALINSLKVIPERAAVTYVNERYMENVWANVRRYSRRGNYYINVEGTTKHTWGNNVTAHFIFYEYLHNEYKRSFVELHSKGCDLLQKDLYIGKAISTITLKMGLPCPAPPDRYALMNLTVPAEDFPNVFPFEKCKVEVILQQTYTNEIMGKGELFVVIKQNLVGKNQKKKI